VAGPEFAPGRRIVLHYTLALPDGTVVDSSRGGVPLELSAGDGSLDPGLERRLHGLRAGDRVRFEMAAGTAFGPRDPQALQVLPRSEFPPGMALEPGVIVEFTGPSGLEAVGTVLACEGDLVRVDFSHPLAERPFLLEVEVLRVAVDNA
jgi:FKBP-type peptidyl-prolyl cis-trans isomerase SlpA